MVGYGFIGGKSAAFVWDSTNGMRELAQVLVGLGVDFTGWNLEFATGVSGDGQRVVGFGSNPSGESEAWLAVLSETPSVGPVPSCAVPSSSPLGLFVLAGALLFAAYLLAPSSDTPTRRLRDV